MLVSIVIPCYNSEHTIGKVVELAIEEFEKLKDYECEFVLVNDYSRDGTWNAIHALAENRKHKIRSVLLGTGNINKRSEFQGKISEACPLDEG